MDGTIATLMQQQLQAVTQLIQSQLQILGSGGLSSGTVPQAAMKAQTSQPKAVAAAPLLKSSATTAAEPAPAGDHPLLPKQVSLAGHQTLTPEQERFIADLTVRYCTKTAQVEGVYAAASQDAGGSARGQRISAGMERDGLQPCFLAKQGIEAVGY